MLEIFHSIPLEEKDSVVWQTDRSPCLAVLLAYQRAVQPDAGPQADPARRLHVLSEAPPYRARRDARDSVIDIDLNVEGVQLEK